MPPRSVTSLFARLVAIPVRPEAGPTFEDPVQVAAASPPEFTYVALPQVRHAAADVAVYLVQARSSPA